MILLYSLAIALSWSIASIIQKILLTKITPIFMLLSVAVILSIFMIIIAFFYVEQQELFIDYYIIFLLFLITILGFLIPNLLLFNLLHNNDINKVIGLAYISPMITVFLAWLILNEKINISSIFGTIFIIIGTYFITYGDTH